MMATTTTSALPDASVDVLRRLEGFCYSATYYLLGDAQEFSVTNSVRLKNRIVRWIDIYFAEHG